MDFSAHMRTVFALRGRDATYTPSVGDAVSCKAIRQGGGQGIAVGPIRVFVERTQFHVLREDIAAPEAGATLETDDATFTVEAVQPVERDVDRLMWGLDANWGAVVAYRSVSGSGTTQNPPQGSGFTISTAAAAGATEVTIGAGFAVGKLVSGDKFTIEGDDTEYSITEDVTASLSKFTDVPITPALAENAAQGADVTFDFARDFDLRAAIAGYEAAEFAGGVQVGDRRLVILQAAFDDAGMTDTPKVSDRVTLEDTLFTVQNAVAIYEGDTVIAWDVQVRA